MKNHKPSVAIVFNHVGEDEFEQMRDVLPESLGFDPVYPIHVATVLEEYEAIAEALREQGCRAYLVNVEDDVSRLHRLLRRRRPEVIFNLVEYFKDEANLESAVAGLHDLHGLPYTGATPFALSLCLRKGLTKQLLFANGVHTPRYHLLRKPRLRARHGLHYPLIVKPAREDASNGIERASVVYNQVQLRHRIDEAFTRSDPPILVEEFIDGRELHVAILGNDPPTVLPILEYDFSELPPEFPNIISYAMKWGPLTEEYHQVHTICPAALPRRIETEVREQALAAYRVTRCRDYARVDLRLSTSGRVYVLEVNPNPDLTEGVSFMESAEEAGLSFSQTLRQIVDMALSRTAMPLAAPSMPLA
ncbi:MAG: D-alanine--D-alanine ligase [Pseudomonadota bacterium]